MAQQDVVEPGDSTSLALAIQRQGGVKSLTPRNSRDGEPAATDWTDRFRLGGSIGRGRGNDPADIRRLRQGLALMKLRPLGDLIEPSPKHDADLDNALVFAQKLFGTKPDGWAEPGGPTERGFLRQLGAEYAGRLAPVVKRQHGERQEEDPAGPVGRRGRERSFGQARRPLPAQIANRVAIGTRSTQRTGPDLESFEEWGPSPTICLDGNDPWARQGWGGPRGDDYQVPVINKKEDRQQSILKGTPASFDIEDAALDATYPEYHFSKCGTRKVREVEAIIEEESRRAGVDPELVKAIVYIENAHGSYDDIPGWPRATIRPMNIDPEIWGGIVGSGADLEDPITNIRAGVLLIRGIVDRVENPTVSKVAALYNNLSLESVRNNLRPYSAWVSRAYVEKPWRK